MLIKKILAYVLAALTIVSVGKCAETLPGIALLHVNIVDVRTGTIRENRALLIRDGIIEKIDCATCLSVPENYLHLEMPGKFVFPGLIDAHVHSFDADEAILYLYNGVTTIVNLHGTPWHLEWRESRAPPHPNIVTSGPIIDGVPPTRTTNITVSTERQARTEVISQKSAGYDLIKIYDNIGLREYNAIIQQARAESIYVTGHIPDQVGIQRIVNSAPVFRAIQHLEELIPYSNNGNEIEIARIANEIAKNNIYVVPTTEVYRSYLEHSAGRYGDWSYVSPETTELWMWCEVVRQRAENDDDIVSRRWSEFRPWIKQLTAANVKLLIGSDAPVPTIIPGFSYHDELNSLLNLGVEHKELLRSATIYASEFLDINSGAIEIGRNADLIVIDRNPLENISALQEIHGLVVDGQWIDRSYLEEQLNDLKKIYDQKTRRCEK